VTDVDPTLAAFNFGKPSFDTSDELPSFSDPRMFVTALLSGFAMVALLLAAIGLYGVVSYAVMQRLREIGIRIAIGATHRNIVALLLRQASVFVLGGVGAGVLVALATVKLLQSLLFQTTTTDITTFVMVPAALTVVAFVASCIPAIRAARTDPTLVMKAE
jgi:putative ABC transport system permease protein